MYPNLIDTVFLINTKNINSTLLNALYKHNKLVHDWIVFYNTGASVLPFSKNKHSFLCEFY